VPAPPFWGRRVVTDLSPKHIFPYVNEIALFRGQWGFKQGKQSKEEFEKHTETVVRPVFEEHKRRALAEGFIEPKVVYGYFPVQSDGDDLIVYHTEEFVHAVGCECGAHAAAKSELALLKPKSVPREWLRFSLPRQSGRRKLCITDFYRTKASGQYDVLALQLVTVGDRATELAEKLRAQDKYQEYLYLHGFGVECAEALAEFWHKRVRQELGFGSEDSSEIRDLFQQSYRGSRYSFGYPACPNLEDRRLIVKLLNPAEIGVVLSENDMLVPEQSTDAIVAHHPQAKYFDV
jgi:5-methyltetrahydrofolate--homocysteine methyltransferase